MNLLGKLLIVLILVGSVMLASFAVVLYATHTNWREQHNLVSQRLAESTQRLAEAERDRDSMVTALNLEIRNQASRNVALSETVRQLTQDIELARNEEAQLREERDLAKTIAESSLIEVQALRVRFDGASQALSESTQQWMEMSTELTKKMDESHGLGIQLANYQAIAAQLAKDYRDAMEVLRKHGLSADPALYTQLPPAGIHGAVTEVRQGGNVEISIGQDSGLVRGHQLDVVRSRDGRSIYVGKIEIMNTAPDRSAARVMPEFRRGVVQPGDEVMYIDVQTLIAH